MLEVMACCVSDGVGVEVTMCCLSCLLQRSLPPVPRLSSRHSLRVWGQTDGPSLWFGGRVLDVFILILFFLIEPLQSSLAAPLLGSLSPFVCRVVAQHNPLLVSVDPI